VSDPFQFIQKALLFTFHDKDAIYNTIAATTSMDPLKAVMKNEEDHTLYLIVNQWNALDHDGSELGKNDNKILVQGTLDAMGTGQRYIFSASANAKSCHCADQK
jgi:hypothetical protein